MNTINLFAAVVCLLVAILCAVQARYREEKGWKIWLSICAFLNFASMLINLYISLIS